MWDKEYLYNEIQLQKQIIAQLKLSLAQEPGSKILQESLEKNNKRLEALIDDYYKLD